MSKYVYEVYNLKSEYSKEMTNPSPSGPGLVSRRDTDTIETFTFDEKTGNFISTGYKRIKEIARGNFVKINGNIVFVLNVVNPDGGGWS